MAEAGLSRPGVIKRRLYISLRAHCRASDITHLKHCIDFTRITSIGLYWLLHLSIYWTRNCGTWWGAVLLVLGWGVPPVAAAAALASWKLILEEMVAVYALIHLVVAAVAAHGLTTQGLLTRISVARASVNLPPGLLPFLFARSLSGRKNMLPTSIFLKEALPIGIRATFLGHLPDGEIILS